jgi:hypothetical protein
VAQQAQAIAVFQREAQAFQRPNNDTPVLIRAQLAPGSDLKQAFFQGPAIGVVNWKINTNVIELDRCHR